LAMRVPRMTTRRWMIAVAAVGIVLSTRILIDRARSLRQIAAHHAAKEKDLLQRAQRLAHRQLELPAEIARARRESEADYFSLHKRMEVSRLEELSDSNQEWQEETARHAEYHGKLRQKFEIAVWRLWQRPSPGTLGADPCSVASTSMGLPPHPP